MTAQTPVEGRKKQKGMKRRKKNLGRRERRIERIEREKSLDSHFISLLHEVFLYILEDVISTFVKKVKE